RLAYHPPAQGVVHLRRVEHFDFGLAVQFSVFGEVDRAHAAARKLFDERVLGAAEVGIADARLQVSQLRIRQPLHFTSTPSSERASVRNSSSVAVISRSLSRTMRRKSRRVAARLLLTVAASSPNSCPSEAYDTSVLSSLRS